MKIFALLFCVLLISCSKKEVSYNYPDNPDYARKSRAGNAFSKSDFVVYGDKKAKKSENSSLSGIKGDSDKGLANSASNASGAFAKSPLWQACIEVIGSLFPIEIFDANSGVITTQWYQEEPNSNMRIKINALVRGAEPTKENLRLVIFRQKKVSSKTAGETWENYSREDSSSGGLSTKLLVDKILEKAKEK